jgi:hypothetical protein
MGYGRNLKFEKKKLCSEALERRDRFQDLETHTGG